MLMCISPLPPGAQLQVRSLVFLDQQVRLTGFSGGTGTDGKERREEERTGEEEKESKEENVASVREQLPAASLQSNSPAGGGVPQKLVFFS